jgi:hypothetical protein
MKVVAYGIKAGEKILLAKVNRKLHDITVIGNELTLDTVYYAAGKKALILTNFHALTSQLLKIVSAQGILLIIFWNSTHNSGNHAELPGCDINMIHLSREQNESLHTNNSSVSMAKETIEVLTSWQNKM